MKILKTTGIILGILALIYVLVITFLPSKVLVERSILVDTSQEEVFEYLEDLRNFQEWSYWAEIDPLIKYDYSGKQIGVGSRVNWSSEQHGADYIQLWITDMQSLSQVRFKIQIEDFAKPADMKFHVSKEGNLTKIHWSFETDFYGHWKFYVPGMETELGLEFETGLLNLKKVLENKID